MSENITLKVNGMSCAHCERRVNQALTALKGVSESKADAKQGAVEITYDSTLVNRANFIAAIEDAGYEVAG